MDRNEKNIGSCFLPAPVGGGFSMEGYWVWCSSVVKAEDGRYHMFASRWPKTLPFHPGWGVASEIVRAVSETPEGPYRYEETVMTARSAAFWDGRSVHNPVIQKCGNRYLLFYMGTTFPFPDVRPEDGLNHNSPVWLAARANKRIGLAVADSIYGPWKRPDRPTFDVDPAGFDNFLVSNPAPCLNPDGSCLLIYKARAYKTPLYDCTGNEMFGDMSLGVAYAAHYDRPFIRLSSKPLFADGGVLEDPFVWRTDTGYAMLAKDWKGTYTGDAGSAIYASSSDGLNWTVENTPAFSRAIRWDDGTVRTMGNLDRPFLLFDENGNATHLFAATNDGTESGFATMTRSWNMCIPLR